MRFTPLTLSALLLLAAGCTPTYTYTFTVAVRNDSGEPITAWLCKDGPSDERAWMAPEELAMQSVELNARVNGVAIPPGTTATVGPISGSFEEHEGAMLRLYRGDFERLSDILAVDPASLNRRDIMLMHDGENDFVVHRSTGRIDCQEVPPPRKP